MTVRTKVTLEEVKRQFDEARTDDDMVDALSAAGVVELVLVQTT